VPRWRFANRTKQRGDAAFESGGLHMATGNWLRSAPGQVDNPTLAKEFAFDWLRRKLGSTRRTPTKSEDAFDC
jgi:hypothetical protein